MRKIIFIILWCALSGIVGGLAAQSTGMQPLSFTKVIHVDSLSKEQIYLSVRKWFATSDEFVRQLRMDEPGAGMIIGDMKTIYSYGKQAYVAYDGLIDHTISFSIKDGRTKVELSNFNYRVTYPRSTVESFGLITSDETKPYNKGLFKGANQKVWSDIQQRMGVYSERVFLLVERVLKQSGVASDDSW